MGVQGLGGGAGLGGRAAAAASGAALAAPVGAEVDGEVGEPGPVAAIKEVLGSHQTDEIILSTLPQRRSRWLARDLPGRVRRAFGLRVTHVVSEPGARV